MKDDGRSVVEMDWEYGQDPIEVSAFSPPSRQPHDGGVGRTLLTVSQVCRHLNIARSTWDKWRQKQANPPVIKLPNGSLRVDADALTAWLAARTESV